MDAVKFIQERRRMYALGCIKKGINDFNTKAEDVVKEVEEWSAAHPSETRQSVFLAQWPNANIDDNGILKVCPKIVEGKNYIKSETCGQVSCSTCREIYWSTEIR